MARDALNLIQVDAGEVERRLADLTESAYNLHDVTAQVAQIMRLFVEDNFENATSFEGGKWDPLSEITLKFRRRSRDPRPLQDTGVLVSSINSESNDDTAEVFTNLNYARYHIEGAELVPFNHAPGVWDLSSRDFFDIDIERALDRAAEEILDAVVGSA